MNGAKIRSTATVGLPLSLIDGSDRYWSQSAMAAYVDSGRRSQMAGIAWRGGV